MGGAVYVGQLDSTKHDNWPQPGDLVHLKKATQLLIQYQPGPNGTVAMNSIPVPIAPADRPTDIVVIPDVILDMSGDPKVGDMYSALTGVTGLHVPTQMPLPLELDILKNRKT